MIAGIKDYAREVAPDFPSLPQLMRWIREHARERISAIPYLASTNSGEGWDGRPVGTLQQWEDAKVDELVKFDRDHPETIADLGKRIAQIREQGPTLKAYLESGTQPLVDSL